MDAARSSLMLNANLPVGGTAGNPGTQLTALNASAMKLKLTSTASTGSASGTEIASGNGYTTGGTAFSDIASSQASAAGSNVTLPKTTAFSWTCALGGGWSIVSLELTDGTGARVWYGNWNGQPIAVANGNTFQVAALAISAGGY
jgi:hypothetical protein